MPVTNAEGTWEGDVARGRGTAGGASGWVGAPYTWIQRYQDGTGSPPEELLGAALAGCFSMTLASVLAEDGHPARRVETRARVLLDRRGPGFVIFGLELYALGDVPGVDAAGFRDAAERARAASPVARALANVQVSLETSLVPPEEE